LTFLSAFKKTLFVQTTMSFEYKLTTSTLRKKWFSLFDIYGFVVKKYH